VLAPVCDDWLAIVDALAADIEAQGACVPQSLRVLIQRGHASGVLALRRAAELFTGGEASQALIVGLDTHGDRATLERLDLLCELRSRRSPGGFVPGEAAAVLCVRPAKEGDLGAIVRGLGVEVEREKPSTACALTSAVAQAMQGWGGQAATVADAPWASPSEGSAPACPGVQRRRWRDAGGMRAERGTGSNGSNPGCAGGQGGKGGNGGPGGGGLGGPSLGIAFTGTPVTKDAVTTLTPGTAGLGGLGGNGGMAGNTGGEGIVAGEQEFP
jgi:hypothetical protein